MTLLIWGPPSENHYPSILWVEDISLALRIISGLTRITWRPLKNNDAWPHPKRFCYRSSGLGSGYLHFQRQLMHMVDKEPLMLDGPREGEWCLLAECWLEYISLGSLQHKCWLTLSPVSLLVGSSAFFQCRSHKSPAAMWFCNSTHLSYERTGSWWTCFCEFELQHGVFLLNLSRGQLDSLFLSWEAWDQWVVLWACSWSQETQVYFQLCFDEVETWQVVWLLELLHSQNEGMERGGPQAF